MDQQKLRTLVFEKTGIKIDTTDPVFALVALNECILEETLQRHLALVRESTHAPAHAAAAATAQPGARQPAFKSSRDNWEADEEQAPPQTHPGAPDHAGNGADAEAEGGMHGEFAGASHSRPAASDANQPMHQSPARSRIDTRLLLLAAAIPVFTAILVLAGQAWLGTGKNGSGITAEQRARLQQSEKLNKAIEKLDAKTKAQLQTELDKL